MEIDKRCISAFAKTEPFVALATKSKLFDPTFSLTSELILVNYMTGKTYPPVTTELKFCKIRWCEFNSTSYLVAGHENGVISIYNRTEEGLVLLKSKSCMEGDITALDFLTSKSILVAGSSKGKVIFWTLSNLEKEYALDIPLSMNISAISWNPNVPKILCIGTSDGVVKVLDIKKNSVIMPLDSKDFSEIKQLEWDPENNTRLIVMSEKGYLNVFDLSNGSVTRVGNHSEPLIGFGQGILVSRNLVENKGHTVEIAESFDCSISRRDPVIALSHNGGSTQIMSIPFVKNNSPFCRCSKYIVTPISKYEIVITNRYEASQDDQFYGTLIKMLYSDDSVDMKAVGDFLLDNAGSINGEYLSPEATININTKDAFTLDLLRGDLSKLKDCHTKINLGLLDCIFRRDNSPLKDVSDFNVLFVFSKLLNDFSPLSRVENPRILAAFIIYNGIGDFKVLEGSREALILRGVLTKNFGEYIDNRVIPEPNYLRRMKSIETYLRDVEGVTSEPISSSCLTELFWYKVFMNELESIKNIRISDRDIEYFIKMNTSASALAEKVKNLGIKQEPSRVNKVQQGLAQRSQDGTPLSPRVYSTSGSVYQSSLNSVQQSFSAQRNYNYTAPTPTSKTAETPQKAFPTASPFPRTSAIQRFSSATHPGTASSSFSGTIPQPQAGLRPKSPHMGIPQPPRPVSSSISVSSSTSGMPSPPASTRMPVLPTSSPKSVGHIPVARPRIPNIPQNATDRSSSGIEIGNPSEVVSNFETMVDELRKKAASKNSLILRQRKIQYLNALGSYNSIDKANVPAGILHVMDLVTKRLGCVDEGMKTDLDVLVDGFGDVLWLKAFVELAKMVY